MNSNSNAEGLRFLNAVFSKCSGEYIEFRYIADGRVTRRWTHVKAITIPEVPKGANAYFGVATRRFEGSGKGDIVEIPAVWIDVDQKNVDVEAVAEKLKNFPLEESIIVVSGGGWHIYWLLKVPARQDQMHRVEDINKRLAAYFGSDPAVAEAARILRLPETLNYKYEPPREVKIEHLGDDHFYALEDFEKVLPPLAKPEPSSEAPQSPPAWQDELLDGVAQGGRNVAATRLAGRLFSHGLSFREVVDNLMKWNERNRPPLPEKELLAVIDSIQKTKQRERQVLPPSVAILTPAQLLEAIENSALKVGELIDRPIPERPFIMTPWLRPGTLACIYAKRGVGKTWIALTIGHIVTRMATLAGKWKTENPVGCLYIDGEMAGDDLQARVRLLTDGLPMEERQLLIISADIMRADRYPAPNLNNPIWRDTICQYLEQRTDIRVLILDNLSSLAPSRRENLKEEWDPVNQWFLNLRAMGIAVIFIHHSGKSGGQRGTSGLEDNLDISIELTHHEDYKPEEGVRLRVSFTKSRSIYGEDAASFSLKLARMPLGYHEWQLASDTTANLQKKILVLINQGARPKDIADTLGCSRANVSQAKKKAIDKGYMDSSGHFTSLGRQLYAFEGPGADLDADNNTDNIE